MGRIKGEKTHINKIMNKKGNIKTDSTEIKRSRRDYYEQFCQQVE